MVIARRAIRHYDPEACPLSTQALQVLAMQVARSGAALSRYYHISPRHGERPTTTLPPPPPCAIPGQGKPKARSPFHGVWACVITRPLLATTITPSGLVSRLTFDPPGPLLATFVGGTALDIEYSSLF